MKPFKTHRQQLRILRDERGLTINDGSRAMRILERENYYAVSGLQQSALYMEKRLTII